MSDERYTAEAFLRAIGVKHIGFPASWNCRQMFSEECDTVTDSITLGLGLEWLRQKSNMLKHQGIDRLLMHSVLDQFEKEMLAPPHYFGYFYLLTRCPRPGAALAKAIIDAQGDGE